MVCSDIWCYQSVKLLIVYASTVVNSVLASSSLYVLWLYIFEYIPSDCIFWMQSFYTLNSAIWWKYLYCCTYALYMQRVSFFVCYHSREKLVSPIEESRWDTWLKTFSNVSEQISMTAQCTTGVSWIKIILNTLWSFQCFWQLFLL